MENVTDSQIEKLMEDISLIKSAISRNKNVTRMILLPTHFKLLYLVSGISIIGFSLVFYLLLEHYGNYTAIPDNSKNLAIGLIVLVWILLVFIKYYKWSDSMSKIDERYDLEYGFGRMFSFPIVNVAIPLPILTIVICVFCFKHDLAYYVIPAISIGLGLLHNFYGSLTHLWQWIASGYWFLATGLFLLVFGPVSVPLAVSISLGGGCILFSLIGWIPQASKEE
jgi:hypothetical protein